MSEKMEKPQVDIEAIMEEIREEVRKKGPYEPIPGLDDIPTSVLRKTDWTVSCAYPAEGGNPLKRLYMKLVSKVVRCALFPLTNRLTQIHEEMSLRMDEMTGMIEDQQKEIDDLYLRIEQLEKGK